MNERSPSDPMPTGSSDGPTAIHGGAGIDPALSPAARVASQPALPSVEVPSIEDPIELADLLGAEERGLLKSACELGCQLSILNAEGRCVFAEPADEEGGTPVGGPPGRERTQTVRREVFHGGDRLALIVARLPVCDTPPRADSAEGEEPTRRPDLRAVHFAVRLAESLILSAVRQTLTTRVHLAHVEEAYCELQLKAGRLEQAVQRMRDADRVKANFLATVSHELRTPLTSVLGYSEMLLDGLAGPLNDEQRDYLSTVMAKGEQLLGLISKLLDVSRIELAGVQLQRRPLDLRDLVHEVVYMQGPQARRKRLQVDVTIPPSLPAVQGDREKLRQVLGNLLSNAIKFTPEHGTVRIVAQVEGGGEQAVRVSVIDSGIGIPAALHNKVFDAFYQVDNSSTREYEGSGLGLAIVRRFVEAHGGRVWVENGPERGTLIHFTLPLPAAPAAVPSGTGAAHF